jgi:hypothetical protein
VDCELGSIASGIVKAEACSVATAAARVANGTKKERFFIADIPIDVMVIHLSVGACTDDVNVESTNGLLLIQNPTADTHLILLA